VSVIPDPLIAVRSGQPYQQALYGQTLTFDFSADVGPGQSILGYGVGLAGWTLAYVTNSIDYAEKLAEFGIVLLPNLCGTTLYVTVNIVMSDNRGDAAGYPAGVAPTTALVTALALIGSQSQPGVFVGNTYQIANGQQTQPITTADNPEYDGFLSGFMLTAADPGYVETMTVGASVQGPKAGPITIAGQATTTDVVTTGTIDALVLSYPYPEPPSDQTIVANFQIVPPDISWGAPDGANGITGSWSAVFSPPTGTIITNWAILQRSFTLAYTSSELQLAQAQYQNASLSGNTVSGDFVLNITNPDGSPDYIQVGSTATFAIIAQFGLPA
jgi:hypothetical protein